MKWSAAKSLLSRLPRRTSRADLPPLHPVPEPGPVVPDDALLTHGLFDAEWYLFRYPEVAQFGAHPVVHFRQFGFTEARDPSPYISLRRVFTADPGARDAAVDDVMERLLTAPLAEREALLPEDGPSFEYLLQHHGLFDEAWYAARNPDLTGKNVRLLEHFVANGANELRDPGPLFDSEFYRSTYPHYIERYASAIEDYVRIGARRGYAAMGAPRYRRWIDAFDTLTPADISRLKDEAEALPCRIVAVHVVTAAGCDHIAAIVAAWSERVDAATPVYLLRGADVGGAAWHNCVAVAQGKPSIVASETAEILSAIAPGTVMLLCGGPVLVRPHAASHFAAMLKQTGGTAAYCDHDSLEASGERVEPSFQPDMSPAFMRQQPYAGRLIAVVMTDRGRAGLLDAIVSAMAGAIEEAWARVLLAVEPGGVAHAPFILFHDIAEPKSAARRWPSAVDDLTSTAAVDATLPRVSVIIPTRDRVELLRACLDSLRTENDYPADRIDYVVVDNESQDPETLDYLIGLATQERVSVIRAPGDFNFSAICNAGARQAKGEILVFLNNDMTVNRSDWLSQLVGQARQADVGLVGAQLLFPDGSVQHGGVVLGIQGVGAHRNATADVGPVGAMGLTRETVAVTGACLAMRRTIFERFGGFDPVLRVAFNDVKLCVAAHEAGFRNICIGAPLLFHHESKSRGFDDTPFKRHRNAREAIYVRERHDAVFRDDPFYSPNLSLQAVDVLGTPPRVVRPWRRSSAGQRRALLLSAHHGIGFGVAVVLQQQAAFLRARGWVVLVGGPRRPREMDYEGCVRVDVWTAEAAASLAVSEGIDVVVAHTDPFFSVGRFLGAFPLLYFTDHGEPPPRFFADAAEREGVDWEKRFCAPMARRVFAISETIKAGQFRADALVLRNGNSHLSSWSTDWEKRRADVRSRLGLTGQFVVLNVCRFGAQDRIYKGVNHYAEIASDLGFLHPQTALGVRFILAGRGDEDDIAEMRAMGLDVHANPSDAALAELYAASDLYMSFSQWEGYNLGIGQAMAMGLDVIASDIAAHREFGVEVSDSIAQTCASLTRRMAAWTEDATDRKAVIDPWTTPLATMTDLIEADLAAVSS
ncbi:glycosyltransferase [Lichenihabitans sp. Uapishka_5]|uniref:glycosyltransferase n=1 Tax=Lichenihabitans sp. Uapishka_5 TaxID=3037302 RepID=UPI0029E7E20D|nr:glycosyltransferase [Lichenihabitans sp. Uapishka_5]MDX7951734.1 glycosyltransferase [Lichenihabitans sp. Uapishka_5]